MKTIFFTKRALSIMLTTILIAITVSCVEDYGSEIDKLKEDVSSLKTSVDKLKEAYEGGKIITGVEPITTEVEGWKITFSDDTAITIQNGTNGADGKNGIDGVTPYVKIDNNCNWIVSYDKGQTYSPIKDADGNTISAKGIDGANGVSVDVQVNSEGKYEIITYLEDKNNPLTILPTPYSTNPDNQISSIVEDSERGMVSITMSSGKQYNFGQALNYPTSIVILNDEILVEEKYGTAEVEFYINPSNAKITKEEIVINQLETVELKSYAESYAKPSPNYEIVSLENSVNDKGEKLKGQYKLTIKHIGDSGFYGELCTLVISTKDAQDNKIEITSEKFYLTTYITNTLTVVAGEGGSTNISYTQVEDNKQVTITAIPNEGYRFVSWSINGEKVSCINPLVINASPDIEVVAKFKELPKQPLRILAIGNSWSTNATQYLNKILTNLGIESTVYNVVKGGGSLKGYYNNTINNTREYFWTINGVKDDNDGNNYSISEILDKGEFDIITIQQVSADGGAYNTFQPYINKFISFIEEKETYDPIIYFHSTWAFPNQCDHPYLVSKYEGSSDVMYSSIFSTWRNIIKDENMDKIIPSTYAVQEIRKIEGIGDIDKPDGRHLSPIGCFTVGCVWAETFIKDLGLNKTIIDLTYNPTSLSSEHFNLIKNIVKTAVERRGIDYNISYDNINK